MARSIEIESVNEINDAKQLLEPGVIRALTHQGRIVKIFPSKERDLTDKFGSKTVICVPPPGVWFEDKEWHKPPHKYEYFRSGRFIGAANQFIVSYKEGREIKKRRDIILEAIGRIDRSPYTHIDSEERERLLINSGLSPKNP